MDSLKRHIKHAPSGGATGTLSLLWKRRGAAAIAVGDSPELAEREPVVADTRIAPLALILRLRKPG